MKLTTPNGELDLPREFTMTVERTNPLLSDQGDASIPVTLPATDRNLAILGHRHRIDRADVYTNKINAILQAGVLQKHGQLVIDTLSRTGGIDVSFAFDSSDLYTKAKDKPLKTIFNDVYEQRNSTATWVSHLYAIYATGNMSYDYNVFPVAVSPYKENDVVRFQINNELGDNTLVSGAREVHDGNETVSVPEGYGIAPFLRLGKMLDRLFGLLGYTVTDNVFNSSPYNRIVLLHNCADCLCNYDHKLYYRDLVPSCTLSEFLNWMLAKFHAQPIVDSESKQVRISLMEHMLGEEADNDLTGKVEGRWKVTLQPSRRIVLTPSVEASEDEEENKDDLPSVESLTKPAAKTFGAFTEKYGEYVAVDEAEFNSLTSSTPYCEGCVVLRKTLGVFYGVEINPLTEYRTVNRIGTNYFTYDRDNSDETEAFDQKDVIPAMAIGVASKLDVCPFIGDRIHYHTAIDNKKENPTQDIMIAQFRFNANFANKTTGTTEDHIPFADGNSGIDLPFSLTNDSMYDTFWKIYNELLLNHAPHITARVKTDTGRLMEADMALPKLCDGQMLIPVKATGTVGDRPVLAECEFLIDRKFAGGVTDPTYPPSQTNGLMWKIENDSDDLVQKVFDLHEWDIWDQCLEDHGYDPPECDPTQNAVTLVQSSMTYGTNSLNVGPPTFEGEVRVVRVPVSVQLTCNIAAVVIQTQQEIGWNYYDTTWDSFVTFTLTAVPNQ